MRSLVIGDVHFGIKTNSLTWLELQIKFFREQIFKAIEEQNINRVIILGDIFDTRYSVNQQVGIELRDLIREMISKFINVNFIFIAGNHDYYSPLEEFSYYNFYELVFSDEFLKCHPNLKIINKEPYRASDGSLFLPWYWTENPDHFDEILYNYDFTHDINAIYCHADLMTWPGARIGSLKGCPVYSGHIHYANFDELSNLYNLGACLGLTFSDVNQDKYIYIIEDHKIVDKIKNTTTPRFIRIFNEEIFEAGPDVFENSYIQLCIYTENINKAKYIERIKYIKSTYINTYIKIHIIDNETNLETLSVEGFNTDVSKYIENNIPEHLDNKYNKIKNKLQES